MSFTNATADHLNEMIGKVRAEKAKVDMRRRHAEINSRNEKAQRLVKRLQDCDGNIASLLSQAADCLQTLISTASDQASSSGGRGRIREANDDQQQKQQERLSIFEARAQEWYATLHDVQIGLRSAARNLRKVQQAPLSIQASMQKGSGDSDSGSNRTLMGSATKGHSLGIALSEGNTPITRSRRGSNDSFQTVKGIAMDSEGEGHQTKDIRSSRSLTNLGAEQEQGSRSNERSLLGQFVDEDSGSGIVRMQESEFQDEIKLSLSALRQQEKGWKQLADALKTVASERKNDRNLIITTEEEIAKPKRNSDSSIAKKKEEEMRQIETDMMKSFATSDKRLMGALMHLYMEVLPETSITPVNAAKVGQST